MNIFENHKQWPTVKAVYQKLHDHGYQALLAGGCVRDGLLGILPKDFDIATDATPDEVEKIFPKALGVGKKFGVMLLPYAGFHVEIATFRTDQNYVDGRRPSSVCFSSAEEDAKRRDFTINALFYDCKRDEIIDYVGGQSDLHARRVRTVGTAQDRFQEDKLRMLRAVRFVAQLDFEMEDSCFEAIRAGANDLLQIAQERIRHELLRLWQSPARWKGLNLLEETGLLEVIIPELTILIESGHWCHSKFAFFHLAPEAREALLWALLFYNFKKIPCELSHIEELLRRLTTPRKVIQEVLHLLRYLTSWQGFEAKRFGEQLQIVGSPLGADLLEARKMLAQAQGDLAASSGVTALNEKVTSALGKARTLPPPLITGNDLTALGLSGARVGTLLNEIYCLQLEGSLKSQAAALLWAKAQV